MYAQAGMHVTGLEGLQAFVSSIQRTPAVGLAVEDLTITLPECPEDGFLTIRQCLQLTLNVEFLVLNLPSTVPATLLDDLVLPKLQLFSTDAPHHCLLLFITINRSLRSLVLRFCGHGSACPLRHLNLAHITELQCPSRCFPGIAHHQVARATVNLTRLASNAALAVRSLVISPLYALTVEFFPNDYDILLRIAAASPRLRKLKLVEKSSPQRRSHQNRRPWNDIDAWHRVLLTLPLLEEFALDTLVRMRTARRSEGQIVSGWANGLAKHRTPHPALYHLAIVQPSSEHGTRQLSEWFKDGPKGQWDCIAKVEGEDVGIC